MDVAVGAGRRRRRSGWRRAGQLPDAARTGFDPGVTGKLADLSLHPPTLREQHAHPARRVFRCRLGRAVRPRGGKPALRPGHAAFFFAAMSLRLIRHSAIWMALSAAPLRKLSETIQSTRPFSTVGSSRTRLI